MRGRAPLLLARPSRFAGAAPQRARAVLLLILLALLASLAALPAGVAPAPDGEPASAIVEGVRHGGDYYLTAAEARRSTGGGALPLPLPLPVLTVVAAQVPARAWTAMAWALIAAVAIAWYARIAPALTAMPARVAVTVLALGGMVAGLEPALLLVPELWAGLFVALSLALRAPGRRTEAIAFGLAAALIGETAAAYLLVMAVLAWRAGDRREAIGWGAGLAVVALVVAAHMVASGRVAAPLDPVGRPWIGAGGAMAVLVGATALAPLPAWLAALLLPPALAGWIAWRDPLAAAVPATLAALLAVAAAAGGGEAVLIAAPIALVGLVFVPDGLRDLVAAALDRRRITVTRVAR